MQVDISRLSEQDHVAVEALWRSEWGDRFVVTRGRIVEPQQCQGFRAVDRLGKLVGLITYQITASECEVITLDTMVRFSGVGSALMAEVAREAGSVGCRRIWFITTNDNLDAIRFYQRRGYTIAAVHVNAVEQARRLKPSIPLVGNYGIPIRDEVEFEKWL
jgi:ribosomal protein S18 acetylase RimI-like enzyme